jgi:hypothetical protein
MLQIKTQHIKRERRLNMGKQLSKIFLSLGPYGYNLGGCTVLATTDPSAVQDVAEKGSNS